MGLQHLSTAPVMLTRLVKSSKNLEAKVLFCLFYFVPMTPGRPYFHGSREAGRRDSGKKYFPSKSTYDLEQRMSTGYVVLLCESITTSIFTHHCVSRANHSTGHRIGGPQIVLRVLINYKSTVPQP